MRKLDNAYTFSIESRKGHLPLLPAVVSPKVGRCFCANFDMSNVSPCKVVLRGSIFVDSTEKTRI